MKVLRYRCSVECTTLARERQRHDPHNRIAKERALPVIVVSRGIAVDKEIPASIREGLAGDGLVPASDAPVGLTSEEVGGCGEDFRFR